jgi:O-antigen ligase
LDTVSALGIRRRLRRQQRRTAIVFAVLAVAFVIAAHHSGTGMDMPHDAGMGRAVAQMCLGVFTAVGAALVAAGLAVLALGRWQPTLTLSLSAPLPASPVPVARARHGPAAVSFLCVSRR